jgi:hypothetical protein
MLLIALLVALSSNVQGPAAGAIAWVSPPRIETPPRALEEGVSSARVVLRCNFIEGRPSGCVILSETPQGFNFGREALRAMSKARAEPDRNGQAEVPVNFGIQDLSSPRL